MNPCDLCNNGQGNVCYDFLDAVTFKNAKLHGLVKIKQGETSWDESNFSLDIFVTSIVFTYLANDMALISSPKSHLEGSNSLSCLN